MVPFKESLKLEYKYYVTRILQKSSKNNWKKRRRNRK